MKTPKDMDVLCVAGFARSFGTRPASRKFYPEASGPPIQEDTNG